MYLRAREEKAQRLPRYLRRRTAGHAKLHGFRRSIPVASSKCFDCQQTSLTALTRVLNSSARRS